MIAEKSRKHVKYPYLFARLLLFFNCIEPERTPAPLILRFFTFEGAPVFRLLQRREVALPRPWSRQCCIRHTGSVFSTSDLHDEQGECCKNKYKPSNYPQRAKDYHPGPVDISRQFQSDKQEGQSVSKAKPCESCFLLQEIILLTRSHTCQRSSLRLTV